jgi:putative SOS response-associated peptidase YedK
MCSSAQIWADFRKYERFGGKLNMREFAKLVGWTKRNGTWIKVVPKALRQAIMDKSASKLWPDTIVDALMAESEAQSQLVRELEEQQARLERADVILASAKPTRSAAHDRRIALNKIASSRKTLEDMELPASTDGNDRIWPGYFAPVLIRDPMSGERTVLPMRYRCRLPNWTEQDEVYKSGTYNARRDKLTSIWRKVFGVHHGVIAIKCFYESVLLHHNQRRNLAPGEREQSIEIVFKPQSGDDLLVACLWTYVEPQGDAPGFYTFAVITDEPPPEVAIAGHDRCVVSLREEDIEPWLTPMSKSVAELQLILDRGESVRPYFEHELIIKSADVF